MPLFAASHMNYAQYGLYYLRTMEQLPDEHFQKGEHTMHHTSGIFNGIWSDMAIETTFMGNQESLGLDTQT